MGLLEQVRREIERVQRGTQPVAPLPDLRWLAVSLIECLGQEMSGANYPARYVDQRLRDAAGRWLHGSYLQTLTHWVDGEVARSWPDDVVPRPAVLVECAVAMALQYDLDLGRLPARLSFPSLSQGRRQVLLEIGRRGLSEGRPASAAHQRSAAADDPSRYAVEVGLITAAGVTSAGRTFMSLNGRTAVEWLAACELVLATGPRDQWRCDRTTAAWLLQTERRFGDVSDPEDRPGFEWETIVRWADLELVTLEDEDEHGMVGYAMTDVGRDILQKLSAPTPSPIEHLAQALVADTAAEAFRGAGGAGTRAAAATIEEATVRQARILAHELRNKLVPLQTAIEVLERSAAPSDKRSQTAAKMARGAIGELFEFVDVTVDLARGLQQPHDWFKLFSAVRDGVASGTNGADGVRVVYQDTLDRFELRGPRAEFVIAVANLVRNAIQARESEACEIRVGLVRRGDTWKIRFDDDGPGVAPELRGRIFDGGYSTRPGGLGLGLGFVRDLVERDLGGQLVCGENQKGGARFELSLPEPLFRSAGGAREGPT